MEPFSDTTIGIKFIEEAYERLAFDIHEWGYIGKMDRDKWHKQIDNKWGYGPSLIDSLEATGQYTTSLGDTIQYIIIKAQIIVNGVNVNAF